MLVTGGVFSQENSSEGKIVSIKIRRYDIDSIMIIWAFGRLDRCLLDSTRIVLRKVLEATDAADFLGHISALIEPQASPRANSLSEWTRGQMRIGVHTRHTRIAP